MPLHVRRDAAHPSAGFAAWRIVAWLILLLAAYGCLQYLAHARQLWSALQEHAAINPEGTYELHRMLAWDVGYFVAAFALIVICAGAILRQAWARPSLQVAAVVLAVGWGLVGGLILLSQWKEFSDGVALTNAQAGLNDAAQAALAHVHRSFQVALATKAIAVPVLLWLAWRLGRPAVRAQFHALKR
ncbi:hypothetical protein ACXU4B_11565 [Dyella soli]|uniref:Uncharacterized protein n=1 Tax=Dyella soli TaxID=522319 RepID=A0A4R0YN15_9GAMM|nr:hypothetical protein [Dyella soli]TCI07199.1 hypothetical protein EZM97_31865 [Dyella soli]